MASIRCAIILAVVVFTLIQNCASFNCYECEAEKCKTNLTEMTRKPCLLDNKCFKLANPKTEAVIRRGCAEGTYCDVYAECETCAEDLCNSSSQMVPFLSIMSIIGVIIAKTYMV